MNYFKNLNDGTPYEGKLSRTVWSGGKSCDYFKGLPITIRASDPFRMFGVLTNLPSLHLVCAGHVAEKHRAAGKAALCWITV